MVIDNELIIRMKQDDAFLLLKMCFDTNTAFVTKSEIDEYGDDIGSVKKTRSVDAANSILDRSIKMEVDDESQCYRGNRQTNAC